MLLCAGRVGGGGVRVKSKDLFYFIFLIFMDYSSTEDGFDQ